MIAPLLTAWSMQHDRMPSPEEERIDLPFEYGRFENSTDCRMFVADPVQEWALSNLLRV